MVNVNDVCIVFYIFLLRTMIESTWKILKLDWKTHRVLLPKEWEPCCYGFYIFAYGRSQQILG